MSSQAVNRECEERTNYYAEPPTEQLKPCALGCGRIEHELSEHQLCAPCEVEGWEWELKGCWLKVPPSPERTAHAESQLKQWQAHAKEE